MAKHPIFSNCFHGNLEVVRELLDREPDLVHLVDDNELTPLHVAAQRGQNEVIKLLASRAADLDHSIEKHSWTPLVWASYRGHLDTAMLLIELGAGVELGNPIHFAGQRGHEEICRLLVEHGAVDHLIRDNPKGLALLKACYRFDHEEVGRILESDPSLVEVRDINGKTALHEVCTNGDLKTAKILLNYGIATDVKDGSGQTAMDRAENHGQKKLVALLG